MKPKKVSPLLFVNCPTLTQKYRIIAKSGSGHSANVFEAQSKASGRKLAIKAFNHINLKGRRLIPAKKTFLSELAKNKSVCEDLPRRLKPKVVEVFDGFEESKEAFIICELMHGDLMSESLQISDAQNILQDIGALLESMHAKGYAHLDINPGELD